jgi:GntR family transcriptional repressor for pyruvate dehydrogenase complex
MTQSGARSPGTRPPASRTPGPRFEPVTRQTVAQQIRDRLAQTIRDGELAAGQALPPERSLCEEFGVARTSVREAIQGLVSMGLVERRGNRTHVVEHLPGVAVDGFDLRKERVRELFEVRRVIEIPAVELAVCRATADERAAIVELSERFSGEMDVLEFRRLDRQFHWTLAQACGNRLLAEMYHKVLDALFQSADFESLLFASANRRAVRHIVASAGDAHRAIAAAVAAGDPVSAMESVQSHLHDIEARMVGQLA